MYYNFFQTAKLPLIIWFAFVVVFSAYGQHQRTVDSLVNVLENSSKSKLRVDANVALALEYFDTDYQKAMDYAEDGYNLAQSIGDSLQMVKAGRIRGQMLRRMDKLQQSIEALKGVLPVARRNNYREDYKKILNALAVVHTLRADYDQALDYNFQSLVVRQEEGDRAEISITLNNIGLVYYHLRNYESALKYFNQALLLKREINDTYYLDALYLNLGLCYIHMENFVKAKEMLDEALKVCGADCNDQIKISSQYGLGLSLYKFGKLEEAVEHLNESLALARKTDDRRYQAENLSVLAQVAMVRNDTTTAREILHQAEGTIKGLGYGELLMNIYSQSAKLYIQTQNYKEASVYQDKYIQIRDSLIGTELVKSIAKIQTNFEERENIATIASKEVDIKQQRDLNAAVAVIAILAGLLILVLQFGNRNIKRVNAKLSEAKEVIQKQNEELESKNRELDSEVDRKTLDLARVNHSLKQVNDELDNFIYKTSHDIRGPLASLKGMCNVALMDVQDPVALDYLRKLDATAERLNSILTRLVIINQINNSKINIERIDFNVIVNDVLMLEKKKGLPVDLAINTFIDSDVDIESDKELVRIVLENLIDNAIKFYNDSDRVHSFISIHIARMDDRSVKARVIDNGIGISESSPGKLFQMFSRASERSETGGIGLYITKTATEKIGGKVGLLTTPEGYTEFYVIFPAVPSVQWEKVPTSYLA